MLTIGELEKGEDLPMERTLDQILAYHCAPSLTGLKPANLVALSREEFPDLEERLEGYRRLFSKRGMAFRTMCGCGRNVLLLLYRPAQLEAALRVPLTAVLLEEEGYGAGVGLEAMLDRLGLRLRTEAEFPHEIGLFLGYPPEDVAGFQRHRGRNCKLCGYWKVYSDVDRAKVLFQRYDQCRESLCARLASGLSLSQVFRAA